MTTLTRARGNRLERVKASRQFRDGRFRNTSGLGPELQSGAFPVMRDFLLGGKKRRPTAALPVEDPTSVWQRPTEGLRITWLGHSTLLIEVDGFTVLTDPVFGERASPVSFAGARRFHPTPITIAQLPPLDAVVLSHDHYDHLCAASQRELARRRVPIVTSLGVGAHLERLGADAQLVTELDWWESHKITAVGRGEIAFTATPSQHFSGRGLTDRNTTLWSSFVIETEHRRLFFSGDTGLTDEFAAVAQRFGRFDVTMLEIGAWHPAWGNIHLGPANALRAFEMLGGGALLPVHWGTFDLALHAWDEPAETLLSLAGPAQARVLTPRLGRPFEPDRIDAPDPWWRTVGQRAAVATDLGASNADHAASTA